MPDDVKTAARLARQAGNVTAEETALPGVFLVTLRRFEDARGVFVETYSRRDFEAVGIAGEFVQDNQSLSLRAGTVRGLHFQLPPAAQAKLVRVLRGRILDVAVDLRAGSPFFGRHVAVELAGGDGRMLYVPAGFAHGFCTLEDMTEVAYKVDAPYAPSLDRGLLWNDAALGIAWPVAEGEAALSDKDHRLPRLADLGTPF